MAKVLKCGDVMPGCDWKHEADTEEELLRHAAKHAAEAHDVGELTDEIVSAVKSAIRDE